MIRFFEDSAVPSTERKNFAWGWDYAHSYATQVEHTLSSESQTHAHTNLSCIIGDCSWSQLNKQQIHRHTTTSTCFLGGEGHHISYSIRRCSLMKIVAEVYQSHRPRRRVVIVPSPVNLPGYPPSLARPVSPCSQGCLARSCIVAVRLGG